MIGELTSIANGPERNVRLVITPSEVMSEISELEGGCDPRDVDHYEMAEEQGEFTLTLVLVDQRRVCFYRTRSKFDMALLLDQLDGVIGERRRVSSCDNSGEGPSSETSWGLMRLASIPKHMEPRVVEGDLLDQDVEVIVNAWNRNIIPWWLLLPQGVSGAIKRRAGYEPFRELGRKGPIPLGGAVETGAGRLPFRSIIHVAGISMWWRSSDNSIRDCVRSALDIAKQRDYHSIAFPIIGAGTGGFSPDRALEIMCDEVRLVGFDGEVRIVRFRRR